MKNLYIVFSDLFFNVTNTYWNISGAASYYFKLKSKLKRRRSNSKLDKNVVKRRRVFARKRESHNKDVTKKVINEDESCSSMYSIKK